MIGEGSFGQVFKECHAVYGRVARKYCIDSCIDKFDAEVKAMRLLQAHAHANVVCVLDVGVLPATPTLPNIAVFTMELCDMDLFELLDCNGTLSEAHLQPIIRQVVTGVLHCMASGVFHGDIKPENVLLKGDSAKVADFGLCAFARTVTKKTTMTLQYAAPELTCTPPLDCIDVELCDVWSLGLTVATCLTGRLTMNTKCSSMKPCARFIHFNSLCKQGRIAEAVREVVLCSDDPTVAPTGGDAAAFSQQLVDFLCACLHPVYTRRARFEALAEMPWLKAAL